MGCQPIEQLDNGIESAYVGWLARFDLAADPLRFGGIDRDLNISHSLTNRRIVDGEIIELTLDDPERRVSWQIMTLQWDPGPHQNVCTSRSR